MRMLFKPVTAILVTTIVIINTIGSLWYDFFTGNHRQTYIMLMSCIIWGLLSFFRPKYVPYIIYFTQVLIMLNWYGQLDTLQESDSREVEFRSLMLTIVLQQLNYNSFANNLFFQSVTIIVPHYLLLWKVQGLFDVESSVTTMRILTMTFVVILLHVGHYLK